MPSQIYLFDWGDTLMVDDKRYSGPMCEWPKLKTIPGAKQTLAHLSQTCLCALATNAEDSSEEQIREALERVRLNRYLDHVFCYENTGYRKPQAEYFEAIVKRLEAQPAQITMVGDDLGNDILGALDSGMNAVWFNPECQPAAPQCRTIHNLTELIT